MKSALMCACICVLAMFCVLSMWMLSHYDTAVADPPETPGVSIPGHTVRSVLYGGHELKGGATIMYTHQATPNFADPISLEMQKGKWYDSEWSEMCNWFRGLSCGVYPMTYLDIGSNIGGVTVPMAQCLRHVLPSCAPTVIAIEASPRNAKLLRTNLDVNGLVGVITYNVAISDKDGGSVSMEAEWGNAHVFESGDAAEVKISSRQAVHAIPSKSLDAIYAERPREMGRVLAMKMRISGYSGLALRGAKEMFSQSPPCYCKIELDPFSMDRTGINLLNVLGALGAQNYEAYKWDAWNWLKRGRDFWIVQKNLTKCINEKLQ